MWVDGGYLNCKIKLLGTYAEICLLLNFEFLGIPRASGIITEQVCSKYNIVTIDLAMPELV